MAASDRAAQQDELEFLQAMSREGEFSWHEDPATGRVSGTLNVDVLLESPLTIVSVSTMTAVRKPPGDNVETRTLAHDALTGEASRTSSADNASSIEGRSGTTELPVATLQENASAETTVSKGASEAARTVERDLSMGGRSAIAGSVVSSAHDIAHLPPLRLYFELPDGYPSSEVPAITLSCQWLNFTQLSHLCQCLHQSWEESGGSVILYTWQQFLANETLKELQISSELRLEIEDPLHAQPHWDPRAIQDIGHPMLALPFLVDYDAKRKMEVFSDSFFDCEICFTTLQGSKCVKMSPCGHIHCRECLSHHTATKISDGDVTKIECPSADCTSEMQPNIIKDLVASELFDRYDKLLLQRTLDTMSDITYCPRPTCRCVTVRDESNMGQCPSCMFCFCLLCKRAWHGVAPCKLLPDDLKDLRETWETLDDEERKVLQVQYGRNLKSAFQEYDSYKWIDTNAKKCPMCSAHIEKTHGCNKMMCTHCNGHFCWLCDAALSRQNPYAHFRAGNSACAGKLFDGLIDDDF